jgi:Phage tail lysozyme
MTVPRGLREFAEPFLNAGYSLTATSAVCANAWLESGIRAVNPSHDGSDGALQWRDASDVHRLTQMKSWCASQRIPWQTLNSQALFTIWDLQNNYRELNAQLRDPSRPLANLTMNFCDIYERPARAGRVPDIRIDYANRCFAELESLYPPSPPTPPTFPPQPPQPWVPAMNPALISILVQVLAPIAEGLLSAVFKHAGVPAAPLHPPVHPTIPMPPTQPTFPLPQTGGSVSPQSMDWGQIAAMIAGELAKQLAQQGQQPVPATPHPIQQSQAATSPTLPTNPT